MTSLIIRTRLSYRSQAGAARLLSGRLVSARVHNLPERDTAQTSRSLSSRKAAA